MASKDSYHSSSDEIISVWCSVCKDENKNVSAKTYCVECQDYYCSSCVNIHSRVPALRTHKLLDKEYGQEGKLLLVPTERCEKHMNKQVDMFCENHDEVGCNTCMAVEHRHCRHVLFIPELMKTRKNYVPEFLQCFDNIKKGFKVCLEQLNSWRTSLQISREQEVQKVSQLRAKLEEKIKEEEQRAIQDIERCSDKLDKELQTVIDPVNGRLEDVENTTGCIKTAMQNISQAFVLMKRNQEKLVTSKEALETFSKVRINHGVKFEPNGSLETILMDQVRLGSVTQISHLYMSSSKGNIDTSAEEGTTNNSQCSCVDYDRNKLQRLNRNKLSFQSKGPQQPIQAIVVAGQDALTASMLAAAPPLEQKQMLGERLFPLIQRIYPDLAGKITGMLLEIDNSELMHMLESSESLKAKVEEAVAVLQAHEAKEARPRQAARKTRRK